MPYEFLVVIVVINAFVSLSLWRRLASNSNPGPRLNKKAATALWRSEPIVPKHDPPRAAGGKYPSLVREEDRRFFADFRDFADVVNRWLADEFTASRFRLQELPDADLRLNVDSSSGPTYGRSFAIYYNQTRVGRLEISPSYDYTSAKPNVRTEVEITWARFFDFGTLVAFLGSVAAHVAEGDSMMRNISAAMLRLVWDHYAVSEFDQAIDRSDDFGNLTVQFNGVASPYCWRRDAPARAKLRS